MNAINLLGVGSPWQWDRVSWMVLNALRYNSKIKELIAVNKLNIRLLDRPNLQLLEYFDTEKINIIIDAILLDAPFGTIMQTKVDMDFIEKLESLSVPTHSSHGINLAQTLTLGSVLNKLPEQLYFFGFNTFNAEKSSDHLVRLRKFRECIGSTPFESSKRP